MSKFLTFLVAAAFALPTTVAAETIRFEDLGESFSLLGTSFQSGSYQFTVSSGEAVLYPRGSGLEVPESGTTSIGLTNQLSAATPVRSTISMRRIDGQSFNLFGFRFAEGRINGPLFDEFSATGIELSRSGFGGDLTRLIFFDGIASNDISGRSFEIFGHPSFTSNLNFIQPGFAAVQVLTFTGFGGERGGYSFLLDDIAVTLVPLPASLTLLLAAVGSIFGLRARRRTKDCLAS